MQTPTKDYTSAVAAKIQGFQTKCLLEGRPFTKEGIKEFIHFGFTDDHYTMGFIFEGFLKTQKKKVDGGLSTYRNYRKYEIVRDLLYAHSDIHENTHLSAIRQKHIIDFNTQKKGAEVVTNSVTGDKSGKPASHKSRVYV